MRMRQCECASAMRLRAVRRISTAQRQESGPLAETKAVEAPLDGGTAPAACIHAGMAPLKTPGSAASSRHCASPALCGRAASAGHLDALVPSTADGPGRRSLVCLAVCFLAVCSLTFF
ncbi:hypothetical protein M885DRAFT_515875 [Pelagophyceae sp. CCMP2097]|nr:hypothetical protein M885DRAFT_515875 [Pelagophyceae sp. CCMP2097]